VIGTERKMSDDGWAHVLTVIFSRFLMGAGGDDGTLLFDAKLLTLSLSLRLMLMPTTFSPLSLSPSKPLSLHLLHSNATAYSFPRTAHLFHTSTQVDFTILFVVQ